MRQTINLYEKPSREKVLGFLKAGDFDKARQMADVLLEIAPTAADSHYASGLVHLMQGDAVAAIPFLKNSHEQFAEDAVCVANLGVACHRAGELGDAVLYLKKALQIKPDYTEAKYNLACAHLDNRQAKEALELFHELSKTSPDNADYICAMADAERENKAFKQAVSLYEKALEKDPGLVRAHINLAPFMLHAGKIDEAISHCRKAIELDASQVTAYKNLGDCLLQQEELEEAMDVYADAYEIEPDNVELCVAIGKVWLETSNHGEAASWFQKALLLDEDNIQAQCCLAEIVRNNGNIPHALELLEPLLEKEPDNIDVLMEMSDALWEDGDAESALEHLKHVQRLQPERVALHGKIGQILSSSGDVDKAIEEYQTALDQCPNCIPALSGLATSQRGKLDESNVKTMETMLENKKLRSGALSSLHSGLAFYYDSKKDCGEKDRKKAAEHMMQANINQWDSRSKRGWDYETQKQEEHITHLIETFNSDYFERVKGMGNPDETPVFIVGMPRSGTTLTEQILARHKKVLGVGERNFAGQAFNQFINTGQDDQQEDFSNLETITREEISSITKRYLKRLQQLKDKANKSDALRVVDKMPDNYSLVGWILTLFPNAKIIHTARDPRDVALSCWMTQFGSIRWACHTEHLVHRIKQYQRIMDHWRKVIPERFIEMNYEDLVANQEIESKRLIEYIGLDWDEDCFKFYESDRLIRTASITQVRQPIYNKSVARWKRYEDYIGDLFAPLSVE
jgi:tetratricopeptide (TPR) repeat protein